MNAEPRLYVYGVTAEAWSRRFGMDIHACPCPACGAMLSTTRPFVQGALRGLQTPPCACGTARSPYVIVRDPAYGDLFTGRERPRRGKRGPKAEVVPLFPRPS